MHEEGVMACVCVSVWMDGWMDGCISVCVCVCVCVLTPPARHAVGHTQSGVGVSLGGGDVCPGTDVPRRTHLTYLCDKDTEHQITEVNQGSCCYFITIKTKYACKAE